MDAESEDLFLNGPAMDPPAGVDPNFINPSNLKIENLAVVTLCLVASTLVVAMRMWTKTRLVRKVVLDDWVCCLAQLTLAGLCALAILSSDRGSGIHQWNIRMKDLWANIPVNQSGRILYCVDLFLIKLAILLQLLRIFVPAHTRNLMFWICHALIWVNCIYYTVYVLLAIFSCNPVKLGWSSQVDLSTEGTCLDLRAAYIVGAVINTASDVSIVILPQPWIWTLQLTLKRKMGLCAIFLIGLSGCAASIVRLVYSVQSTHVEDLTYLEGKLNLWAIAEATCGILAMCLPVSPKFIRSVHDSQLWSALRVFSFSRSKSDLARNSGSSETPSDEKSKAAKLSSGAPNFKAYFKQYNYRSVEESELDSVSTRSGITNKFREDRRDVELA